MHAVASTRFCFTSLMTITAGAAHYYMNVVESCTSVLPDVNDCYSWLPTPSATVRYGSLFLSLSSFYCCRSTVALW